MPSASRPQRPEDRSSKAQGEYSRFCHRSANLFYYRRGNLLPGGVARFIVGAIVGVIFFDGGARIRHRSQRIRATFSSADTERCSAAGIIAGSFTDDGDCFPSTPLPVLLGHLAWLTFGTTCRHFARDFQYCCTRRISTPVSTAD